MPSHYATPRPIPGFHWNAKARGWYRSYKNRPVYCGGRNASRADVERAYQRKKDLIDGAEVEAPAITLRLATSRFLAACKHRVDSGKPRPLSSRMLHNYQLQLNHFGAFIGGDALIDRIGPEDFERYAKKFAAYSPAAFDSVVTRVGALFHWAGEMGYIDRYRPGPAFQRPGKQEVRDKRIARTRRFSAEEVARLYAAANDVMRCWIGLGVCCAFNNSDVANLTRDAVVLDADVPHVDFRRRKTGKVRRVCPLPAEVVADLKRYVRPEPATERDAELFFLTRKGHAYCRSRKGDGKPVDAVSRLFARLIVDAGVEKIHGRNFAGLRTTTANLAPPGYRDELELIMGHAKGSILLDHYLEDVGMDRLVHVVRYVWGQVQNVTPS